MDELRVTDGQCVRVTESAGTIIQFAGVTKWFFKGKTRLLALEDIWMDVPVGAFTSLVGPSGCGKSTLFNMVAGFVQADRGYVSFKGAVVKKPSVGIGYMTQKDTLLPWRSVLQNVMLPLQLQRAPKSEARERAIRTIAQVGLSGFADHLPRELSGGMLKRAALARMLVFNPDVLLMDEPFGNVDVQLKLQLQRELLSLWSTQSKTVVFVTHDLEEAIALSDRVVVISQRPGRIRTIVEIDLPRPRDPVAIRFEPAFQKIHRKLWELCEAPEAAVD